jgi:hypothetical protein
VGVGGFALAEGEASVVVWVTVTVVVVVETEAVLVALGLPEGLGLGEAGAGALITPQATREPPEVSSTTREVPCGDRSEFSGPRSRVTASLVKSTVADPSEPTGRSGRLPTSAPSRLCAPAASRALGGLKIGPAVAKRGGSQRPAAWMAKGWLPGSSFSTLTWKRTPVLAGVAAPVPPAVAAEEDRLASGTGVRVALATSAPWESIIRTVTEVSGVGDEDGWEPPPHPAITTVSAVSSNGTRRRMRPFLRCGPRRDRRATPRGVTGDLILQM